MTNRSQNPLKLNSLLMSGVCLLLSSCGGLLNSEQAAERTFLLTPYAADAASTGQEQAARQHGLVLEVGAVPGLDTDLMLTLSPDAELNHFSGARWPDHLPEFAASLLRRSIQGTGWFSHVSDGHDSGLDDCELDLEVQKFYTSLDGAGAASTVQISLSGSFACADVSSALQLDASAQVGGRQLAGVVAAHQRALDDILRDLLFKLDHLLQHTQAH